jgi:hypothetical protein
MTTALLPRNPTATDVIDALSDQAFELVSKVNADRLGDLTPRAFAAAHARCFTAMLDTFLLKLDERNPSLARRIRADFLNQQDSRAARGEG